MIAEVTVTVAMRFAELPQAAIDFPSQLRRRCLTLIILNVRSDVEPSRLSPGGKCLQIPSGGGSFWLETGASGLMGTGPAPKHLFVPDKPIDLHLSKAAQRNRLASNKSLPGITFCQWRTHRTDVLLIWVCFRRYFTLPSMAMPRECNLPGNFE